MVFEATVYKSGERVYMYKDEEAFFNWYNSEATPDDQALMERVDEFGEFFDDMLFRSGTSSFELTTIRSTNIAGNWITVGDSLPEELDGFDYSWFRYKAEKPKKCDGFFREQESLLCAPPDAEDSTVLHEMIHLHESVINGLPMYFHDMLYWALYQDLRDRIPALDEIITAQAHLLTGSTLYESGGLHDILFLLKSFDLDIRMGYPLGTVFGYGRVDDFKGYEYKK